MSSKVRVKDGALLGGHDSNGARLYITPGTYKVELTADGVLVFSGADIRNNSSRDLYVHLDEYLELEDFPEVAPNPLIEML